MTTRTLPATWSLPRLPWRWVALGVIAVGVALNLYFLAMWLPWEFRFGPWDYPIYTIASHRLFDGTMYHWGNGYIYPYSPVFAYLMVPLAALGSLGFALWRLAHVAAVFAIPSWPLRVLLLISWGFWMDTIEGNVGAFFMVLGYWAVRDKRWAGWSFFALLVMIPKPLYVPLAVWLLWRHPEYRRGVLTIVAVHAGLVLATGYGFEWLAALPGASHDIDNPFNILPSRIIGVWWWPIGLVLAAWLIVRDHPGWAGIAASLYGGPGTPLMLLFEPDASLRKMGRFLFPRLVAQDGEEHLRRSDEVVVDQPVPLGLR